MSELADRAVDAILTFVRQKPSEPKPPLCQCGHTREMHHGRAICGGGWCSCVHYLPQGDHHFRR